MTEYLALAVAISALVAIGGILIYSEEHGKEARAAMGIILLCTVAIPPIKATLALSDLDVGGLFEDIGDIGGNSALEEAAGESFCEGVEKMLCDKFSLDEGDVAVYVFGLDTSTMRADKITVVLRGRGALADLRGIESLVEDSRLGNCEVKIEAS